MAKAGRMVNESMVEEIGSRIAERPNMFITTLERLPADETDGLRRKLSRSQAHLVMVKRRLGRRAVEKLNLPGLAELLHGSVGLVLVSDDSLAIAKLLMDFKKSHAEQLVIRGAVVDGQLLDKNRVEELASLPPKPMLLAQVVITIESPLADVIFTMERLIGDIAWNLEQAAAKKPAEPAAARGEQQPHEGPAAPDKA